jgi:homoserine kinase
VSVAAPAVAAVAVPATSANLGSAFDTAAVALDWHLTVTVRREAAPVATPSDGLAGLAARAAAALFGRRGAALPNLSFAIAGDVPPGRGLGSSACAVVGALLAAGWVSGRPLRPQETLELAAALEGHADNAAACLMGGAVWTWQEGEAVRARPLPVPDLQAALFVPDTALPTAQARAVLPAAVPLGDAVHNLQRAGLWPLALWSGDLDLLRAAGDDRLHQSARSVHLPHLRPCVAAAYAAGARYAGLSGAGSSILALAGAAQAGAVAEAMAQAAAAAGVTGFCRTASLDRAGARRLAAIAP